jgi:hypothetical protein
MIAAWTRFTADDIGGTDTADLRSARLAGARSIRSFQLVTRDTDAKNVAEPTTAGIAFISVPLIDVEDRSAATACASQLPPSRPG